MAEVLDWQSVARAEVVKRACEVLTGGGLVAFPTETVYGIAADPRQLESLQRLVRCKGRPENKPLTLAVASPAEAMRWLPALGRVGQRLARRCWPGPLTLVSSDGVANGLLAQLPAEARQLIAPEGSLGVRVPAHDAILDVLEELGTALALTSANLAGAPDAIQGSEVIESLGDKIDLIIDDGPTPYRRPSTVVRVDGGGYEVLRPGVLSPEHLQRLSRCLILFVCTGNTCRSPMAERLCKKLLAERLGCAPGELEARGFLVHSAGVFAMMGAPASVEAVVVARQRGADLEGHVSQPLTAGLLHSADYVFTMTNGHRRAVEGAFGPLAERIEMLSPEGNDIADPIGSEIEVYDQCADEIARCLERRIPSLEA